MFVSCAAVSDDTAGLESFRFSHKKCCAVSHKSDIDFRPVKVCCCVGCDEHIMYFK
jgi:hypothetical protein